MSLWCYEVNIFERETGPEYPAVQHRFYGRSRDEAHGYYEAHRKTDAFLDDCVEHGEWDGVDCWTTARLFQTEGFRYTPNLARLGDGDSCGQYRVDVADAMLRVLQAEGSADALADFILGRPDALYDLVYDVTERYAYGTDEYATRTALGCSFSYRMLPADEAPDDVLTEGLRAFIGDIISMIELAVQAALKAGRRS